MKRNVAIGKEKVILGKGKEEGKDRGKSEKVEVGKGKRGLGS